MYTMAALCCLLSASRYGYTIIFLPERMMRPGYDGLCAEALLALRNQYTTVSLRLYIRVSRHGSKGVHCTGCAIVWRIVVILTSRNTPENGILPICRLGGGC